MGLPINFNFGDGDCFRTYLSFQKSCREGLARLSVEEPESRDEVVITGITKAPKYPPSTDKVTL